MLEIVRLQPNDINSKCGEIHSYNAVIFTFTCNFCGLVLNSFEPFCLHIREEHFLPSDAHKSAIGTLEDIVHVEEENKSEVLSDCGVEDAEDADYFEQVKLESPRSNDLIEACDENEENVPTSPPQSPKNETANLDETEFDVNELQIEQVLVEEDNLQESTLPLMYNESEEYGSDASNEQKRKKSKYVRKKKKKPTVRIFHCSHCGKSFKNKSNCNMHELRHKEIGDFKCNLCPKAFYTKMELTKHLRSHNDERPYVCEVCGKAFRHIWVLKKHGITHMALERTVPCSNCGKLFLTKDHLRIHMLTHNTVPMFGCDSCGEMFTQRKRLNVHKRKHHRDAS